MYSGLEPALTINRIVAVGLLTEGDLQRLGPSFERAWAVDETPCFGGLLSAIDDADRDIRRQRDAERGLQDAHATAEHLKIPLIQ